VSVAFASNRRARTEPVRESRKNNVGIIASHFEVQFLDAFILHSLTRVHAYGAELD
jgi:hypothetical protein